MVAPAQEPAYLSMARLFRQSLDLQDRAMMRVMTNEWVRVELAMQREMNQLLEKMARDQLAGRAIGYSYLYNNERFQRMMAQVHAQYERFADVMSPEILKAALQSGKLGTQAAVGVAEAMGIHGVFDFLNTRAVQNIVALNLPGGQAPLRDLLVKRFGKEASEGVAREIIKNAALGYNPRQIAQYVRDNGLGQHLNRALLISRDQQIRAYRTASLETYRANSDVIVGMKRLAAKNARTCWMCMALDGRIYELYETPALHPQDRCTFVPIVEGYPEPHWMEGRDWFEAQSEQEKLRALGKGRYDLYKKGMPLTDMISVHDHPIWGPTVGSKPLKSLPVPKTPSGPLELIEMQNHFRDWMKGVTPEENKTLRRYLGGSFRGMNDRLRNLVPYDQWGENFQGLHKTILDLSQRSPGLPRDAVLHRVSYGYKTMWDDLAAGKVRAGSVIADRGFASTSIHPRYSVPGESLSNDVRYRISAKKGTKGVFAAFDELNPRHVGEGEFILPPGSKMKITKVTKVHGTYVLDVDLLDNPFEMPPAFVGRFSTVADDAAWSLNREISMWQGTRQHIALNALESAPETTLLTLRNATNELVGISRFGPLTTRRIHELLEPGISWADVSLPGGLKNYIEVRDFATREAGWGRHLVDELLNQASRTRSGLVLRSIPSSIGFYEKLGFSRYGGSIFYLTPDDVMRLLKGRA